jgi:hypothetical protein
MATYLVSQSGELSADLRRNIYILNFLQKVLYENGETELGKKYEDAYKALFASLQSDRRTDY